MKKTRKMLAMLLSMMLVAVVAIGGTYAYLTAKTDVVTNTFTVGNVAITLDEAKVDLYGDAIKDAARVTENEYKLIPGHEYTKDPTVHVTNGSEDCWVFVKLENGLKDIIDATTIEDQMTADGKWTLVDADENVYAYKEAVSAGTDVEVFATFKLKGDANVAAFADAEINITAYAVQADGFDTAAVAWTKAPATWEEAAA